MKKVGLLSLIFLLASFMHPFYLSVTDLKYNPKEQALQGSVKLFINDFESTLRKIYKQPVDLINTKDTVKTKAFLEDYLKKNLSIQVNAEQKTYQFIGFEREQEAIWLYIEVTNCPLPKTLDIKNSILYESLKDQMNIVHIDVKGIKKSSKVNNPESHLFFEFDQKN